MKKVLACLLAISSFATLYADSITLSNGDSIQGQLVSMENGKVVFNSELAGKISVDQKSINSMNLSTDADFLLADGRVVKTTGEITATSLKLSGKAQNDISTLTAINPGPPALPKLSGNITVGVTSSHGNTYAESGSVSAEINNETEKGVTAADFTYYSTRSEDTNGVKYTTEEFFTAGAKPEFNLSEKTYGFLDARYKTDHIADLDERIIGTIGLGRRLYKTEIFKLNADIGLSQVHEKYTVNDISDTNDDLSVRLGYNLNWKINPRLSFKHNLEYYPSTKNFSDYYLTTKAEFRYKFSDQVYGSFKTLLDFDATPAVNSASTDIKYILGLGIDF